MSMLHIIVLSTVGGLVPALFWLWFWLKEDKRHPEPTQRLMITFIGGVVAAQVTLYLEQSLETVITGQIPLIFTWVVAEEMIKFIATYLTAFRSKAYNEPIDAPIYLITTALGFAAAENALFLGSYFADGQVLGGILAGNLRFIGAMLLHLVASAAIGVSIALVFYKPRLTRIIGAGVGMCIAIALHMAFNFFIIHFRDSNIAIMAVFVAVWVAVIILIALFERIKRLTRTYHATT